MGPSDFISEYEEKLRAFESRLRREIARCLEGKNGSATTHGLVEHLRESEPVFDSLYRRDRKKALYRLRKILSKLRLDQTSGVRCIGALHLFEYRWSSRAPREEPVVATQSNGLLPGSWKNFASVRL